jgi:multisubunit Na+/H+ antiporter MnhG subunit
MDFKTKRHHKRMLIMYTKITWYCILTFILGFIFIMVFHKYIPTMVRYILGGLVICSPFVALFMISVAHLHDYKLKLYKANIKEYRVRKNYQRVMDYIETGEIAKAIDVYNEFIPKNHELRNYLYAALIHESKYCNDEMKKEQGQRRIETLRESYNPSNVQL